MIRYPVLALCLSAVLGAVLQGCTANVPISQFDAGVPEMCQEGLQTYQGRTFNVHLYDSPDDLYTHCLLLTDREGQACISGLDIYVPGGRTCPRHMAHELNHGFGNHAVDRPEPGSAQL